MSNRSHRFVAALGFATLLAACGTQPPPTPPASQTITFAELADRFTNDAPFELSASASSGLPVGFAAAGVCSVSGSLVTLDGVVGSCTITASQAGGSDTEAADPVDRSFDVGLRHVGFVLLSETGQDDARTISGNGTFVARGTPLTDVFPGDPFAETTGTCLVTTTDEGGDPTPVPDPVGTPVAAGTPLTVRDDGGVFATFTASTLGSYDLNGESLSGSPLPTTGLRLEVPGDAFPAFADASFADTAPFLLDAGFDPASIDADTVFGWQASSADGAVALLIGGDGTTVFSCVVPDDGEFAFDETTRTELAGAGFTVGTLQAAGRLTAESHVDGDALLTLSILRLASFDGTAAEASSVRVGLEALRSAGMRTE